MKQRFSAPGMRQQRGVSLLEVLISAIILALGLLGLAGLQMNALRNNQSSMERSMAVVESYSIIDAMRIDRDNAIDGGFDIALDADPVAGSFAGNEIGKWQQRLQDLLGDDASGAIACVDSVCTVTVQWNDERGTGGSSTHQIVTEVRL